MSLSETASIFPAKNWEAATQIYLEEGSSALYDFVEKELLQQFPQSPVLENIPEKKQASLEEMTQQICQHIIQGFPEFGNSALA